MAILNFSSKDTVNNEYMESVVNTEEKPCTMEDVNEENAVYKADGYIMLSTQNFLEQKPVLNCEFLETWNGKVMLYEKRLLL